MEHNQKIDFGWGVTGRPVDIQKFMDDNYEWTETVFPEQTVVSSLSHLKSEVKESLEEVCAPHSEEKKKKVLMEFADMYTILLNATKLAGFSFEELHQAGVEKMKINRSRQWGEVNEEGFQEHVK